MVNKNENSALGIGEEDIEDAMPKDFQRGAGGAPKVRDPDDDDRWVTYARTSSLGDSLDSKDGLMNWLVDRAVLGVAKNPDIAAEALAAEGEWRPMQIVRDKAISAGRGKQAADIGTAVHRMTERYEQEPEWDPGPPYTAVLDDYLRQRDELGLVSAAFEVKIVNDELGCAGTADRLFETTIPLQLPNATVLPAGSFVIADFKTGDLRKTDSEGNRTAEWKDYGLAGYAVQMAGYAGGVFYDVDNEVRLPTPPMNTDWAILIELHVESGTAAFSWIDLDVGRVGAQLALDVREWRRAWRRKDGFKQGLKPVEPVAEIDTSAIGHVGSWRKAAKQRRDEPAATTEDLREFALKRVGALKQDPDARQWAVMRWPEGVPSPRKATTLDELLAINKFLDCVEAEFGAPFPEDDPRPRLVTDVTAAEADTVTPVS